MIHLKLFTILRIHLVNSKAAIRAQQQDNDGAGESLCVAGFYDSVSREKKTEEKNTNQICSRIKWKLEEQIKVQRKEKKNEKYRKSIKDTYYTIFVIFFVVYYSFFVVIFCDGFVTRAQER